MHCIKYINTSDTHIHSTRMLMPVRQQHRLQFMIFDLRKLEIPSKHSKPFEEVTIPKMTHFMYWNFCIFFIRCVEFLSFSRSFRKRARQILYAKRIHFVSLFGIRLTSFFIKSDRQRKLCLKIGTLDKQSGMHSCISFIQIHIRTRRKQNTQNEMPEIETD